jgi:hypothetical protein
MGKEDCVRIPRLVFSVLLGSFCTLVLLAALQGATWATRLDSHGTVLDPEIRVARSASDVAFDEVTVTVEYTAYLPILARNYRLFVNGSFEDGLTGWDTGRGPFSGHGSGLPQSVVVFREDYRALLAEEGDLAPGSIPVGYGYIAQTFTVDRPYVQLQYWVFSHDIAKGDGYYYDTFEVSLNRSPSQILDSERESRGCASTALNPEGTLTVSGDGLVFCGGRPGTSAGTLWDTGGWKTVTLDLSAFQGTNVTLYLAIWSREYGSPDWDDRAWFNTWTYVDNVQPQSLSP